MCLAVDGFSEYYYLHQVFEAIGFPPIDDSEYAPCGIIGLNEGCSSQRKFTRPNAHVYTHILKTHTDF